jgi:hypothetical protein
MMDSEVDKVRADLKRHWARQARAADKQARMALAESILQTEGRLLRVEEATGDH